jgi:aminopeptidase N
MCSHSSKTAAWEYIKANWAAIHEKFQSSGMMMNRVATLPLAGFVTLEAAADAEAFFAANPCPAASMGIAQAIEAIKARAATLSRESDAITAFFSD